MTNEFKKITGATETHYVLETATGGATSAGSIASVPGGVGKVQKRGNLLAQEEKKEAPKPRNFVAKNAKMGGAGQHKDKKKAAKQGNVKHKKPLAEDHEIQMASSELQSIAKNAVHLLDLVRKYSEQEGLDAWQQSKITKAADYLNAVLQSISGEQTPLEGYGRNRGYQHGFASPTAPRLGGRPNHGDDERHDLDNPELQRNRQEVTSYNITIDGKPINPKPIFGRSATIAWGKEQAATGMDLSNAMISPVREGVAEGAKVDRQAKHITKSMMKKGKSKKDAEGIAWAHIKHPKNESIDPYFAELTQKISEVKKKK
jgi:hypothetical protein